MPISDEKTKALQMQMKKLGIYEKDIDERFIRSSGPGGQNVNKTSTCVRLKHIPTGIEVKCQRERSQALNRFFARRRLVEKIKKLLFNKKSAAERKKWKIKKQKKKRSKRAKEKILANKKHQSEKKKLRKKVKNINGIS